MDKIKKSERVNVRLTPNQKSDLDAVLKSKEMSLSQYIDFCVQRDIKTTTSASDEVVAEKTFSAKLNPTDNYILRERVKQSGCETDKALFRRFIKEGVVLNMDLTIDTSEQFELMRDEILEVLSNVSEVKVDIHKLAEENAFLSEKEILNTLLLIQKKFTALERLRNLDFIRWEMINRVSEIAEKRMILEQEKLGITQSQIREICRQNAEANAFKKETAIEKQNQLVSLMREYLDVVLKDNTGYQKSSIEKKETVIRNTLRDYSEVENFISNTKHKPEWSGLYHLLKTNRRNLEKSNEYLQNYIVRILREREPQYFESLKDDEDPADFVKTQLQDYAKADILLKKLQSLQKDELDIRGLIKRVEKVCKNLKEDLGKDW